MLTRPDTILRVEGLTVLAASTFYYFSVLHGRWSWFLLLFLVPDLSLLGYVGGGSKRVAAIFYNAVHNYLGPALLGFAAWRSSSLLGGQLALIWVAHIAFDRLLGFGLKYPMAFKPTHIQTVSTFRSS